MFRFIPYLGVVKTNANIHNHRILRVEQAAIKSTRYIGIIKIGRHDLEYKVPSSASWFGID